MPSSLHDWLAFDVDRTLSLTTGFIAQRAEQAGAKTAVIGISGGLDSATTLALATDALGPQDVDAVFLPGPTTSTEDERFAQQAAKAAGVELHEVRIGPSAEALEPELGIEVDRMVRGNLQARLRMCALYGRANANDGLVLGTGNKSEILTGYFTKHGDGAADLLPLGDIYKTQERMLAAELGVPDAIIERPPTAGLWEGQTDEEELGLTYTELDIVLAGLEQGIEDEEIARQAGLPVSEVDRVRALVHESEHKRALPPVAELGASLEEG